jgi:2-polyprenyl-3-methyl-5-hydroxy-6-metoxy-1,4-benzoquinol methylase
LRVKSLLAIFQDGGISGCPAGRYDRKTGGQAKKRQNENTMSSSDYDAKTDTYFAFARTEILPLLPSKFTRVADVGGSSGATLSAIKALHPGVETICIDGHAPSVDIARSRGHTALVCDLEGDLPAILQTCDVVLLLDVLEHLKDPWRVLRDLVRVLEPGAVVIVSLPNVRHWAVSAGLFFLGSWQLQDAGILDRTHLRFFTRETGRQLVQQSGLSVQGVKGKLAGGRKFALINLLTAGLMRDFLNMQYLFVGKKQKADSR